jgi:hypothetical protein
VLLLRSRVGSAEPVVAVLRLPVPPAGLLCSVAVAAALLLLPVPTRAGLLCLLGLGVPTAILAIARAATVSSAATGTSRPPLGAGVPLLPVDGA